MNFDYKGRGSRLQIGKEATHGTLIEATQALDFLSESIGLDVSKKAMEGISASRTINGMSVTGYEVNGDFVVLGRPDEVGMIFSLGLGTESAVTTVSTGYYKHVFTATTSNTVPSFTVKVDKGIEPKAYIGSKIASISIDGKTAEDLKLNVGIKGKNEADTTMNDALSTSQIRPLSFIGSSVKFDTVTADSVTGVLLTIDNGLDTVYTNSLTPVEPISGDRSFKVKVDGYIDTAINGLKDSKYIGNGLVDVELTFISPSEVTAGNPYKLIVKLPKVVITSYSQNVDTKDRLSFSFEGVATEVSGTEPISVELYDAKNAKYIP